MHSLLRCVHAHSHTGTDLLLFTHRIEVIHTHTLTLTHIHTHTLTHTHTHTKKNKKKTCMHLHTYLDIAGVPCFFTIHDQSLDDLRDEVNGIMGKKKIIFKERKIKDEKKLNLSGAESL